MIKKGNCFDVAKSDYVRNMGAIAHQSIVKASANTISPTPRVVETPPAEPAAEFVFSHQRNIPENLAEKKRLRQWCGVRNFIFSVENLDLSTP